MKKTIDILCVGEVLIDFIGHEVDVSVKNTKGYNRYLGGSPTNVAINAAKLGLRSALVASCGKDGLGEYIIQELDKSAVNITQVRRTSDEATSVIFVSKSTGTPDFISYREADCQIIPDQIPEKLLEKANIFHTTCFALSKNPARSTILESVKKAKALGLQISIDINFSERIWPDRKEAHQVLKNYLSNDPLVKISEDDCLRLFGEAKSEDYIFGYFHNLGVSTICLTKGKDGVVLSEASSGLFYQEAIPIKEVKDSTGAGDAFWTGFLYAKLNNKNSLESIGIAQKLASLKLQNIGGLPEYIDLSLLLNDSFSA